MVWNEVSMLRVSRAPKATTEYDRALDRKNVHIDSMFDRETPFPKRVGGGGNLR